MIGIVSGVAMALGPSLGGLIGSGLGWRWIFLANVPVCLLIAFAVPRVVAETRDGTDKPSDWLGVAILTLALGLVITVIWRPDIRSSASRSGSRRQPDSSQCSSLGSGAGRGRCSIQPPSASRPMAGVAAQLVAVSVGYWAVLVYIPLFLGTAFGWTARGGWAWASRRDPPHAFRPSRWRPPRIRAGLATAVRIGADPDRGRWVCPGDVGPRGAVMASPRVGLFGHDVGRHRGRAFPSATYGSCDGARTAGGQRYGVGHDRYRAAGRLRDRRRRSRCAYARQPIRERLRLALWVCDRRVSVRGAGLPSAPGVIAQLERTLIPGPREGQSMSSSG